MPSDFTSEVHGLGKHIVKSQPKNVGAEIVDAGDAAGSYDQMRLQRSDALLPHPDLPAGYQCRGRARREKVRQSINDVSLGRARNSPDGAPASKGEILRPNVGIHASVDRPEQRLAKDQSPSQRKSRSWECRNPDCRGRRSAGSVARWKNTQTGNALYPKQAVVNLGRAADVDHNLIGIELPFRTRQLTSRHRAVIKPCSDRVPSFRPLSL